MTQVLGRHLQMKSHDGGGMGSSLRLRCRIHFYNRLVSLTVVVETKIIKIERK